MICYASITWPTCTYWASPCRYVSPAAYQPDAAVAYDTMLEVRHCIRSGDGWGPTCEQEALSQVQDAINVYRQVTKLALMLGSGLR
jgi:hypothetical protein